jgi:hypothetical protein
VLVAIIPTNGGLCELFVDTDMEDGYYRVEGEPGPVSPRRPVFISQATSDALFWADKIGDVVDNAEWMPAGTRLIPARLLDPGAAREVEMTLDLLEADLSTDCAMPHCLQPATSAHRGFSLCTEHGALMDEWDELVAV